MTAPAHSTISPPVIVSTVPDRSTSIPTARPPAITTRRAVTLLSIVRFGLLRFGEMYASAALTLMPSTTLRGRPPQPGAPGAFLSGSSGVAELRARGGERPAQRMQRVDGGSRHRHRPAAAVVRGVGEVEIVLEPAEERQHLGERPPVVALRGPAVEVSCGGADEHSGIHGARSAHHLAPRHRGTSRRRQSNVERPVGRVPFGRADHHRRIEQVERIRRSPRADPGRPRAARPNGRGSR